MDIDSKVINTVPDHIVSIYGAGNKMMVTIKPDGTLEYGESYDPDEAAKMFWSALAVHSPGPMGHVAELKHEIEVLRRYGNKDCTAMADQFLEDEKRGRPDMSDEFPRRNRIEKMTAAELAIREAVGVVEDAGCDPLLTDAVCLLSEAQDRVADFVDGVPREEKRTPMGDTAAYEKGFADGAANKTSKTLHNTKVSGAKENVKDIQFYGNGDLFKCLSKAWSKEEGWMKSTKAMNVPHGVVVQVTTQQGDNVSEALTYVPGCHVEAVGDEYVLTDGSELDVRRKKSYGRL